MIQIHSQFDGGSIVVVEAKSADNIQLRLKPDRQSDLTQWFYFGVSADAGCAQRIAILDVDKTRYPEGWPTYQTLASYNRAHWFCVPTTYDGHTLTIRHTPTQPTVFYAYTTPYTYERHLDFVQWAGTQPRCDLRLLGTSVEGRAMHLLTIGEPAAHKRRCWFIGRQHSGETMAEWCLEGVVRRLLDTDDALAHQLLEQAVFYVVPNMNPDGAATGHQRLNALGVDLNREWSEPSGERSPEVFVVRRAMHETGVDFFLDAHGDENIPYVFLAARPLTERLGGLQDRYRQALLAATPEFQTEHGYVIDPAVPVNRQVAVNYVGLTFDCLSFTLEMPFQDNARLPHPAYGWSAARSKQFGAALLQALADVIQGLR